MTTFKLFMRNTSEVVPNSNRVSNELALCAIPASLATFVAAEVFTFDGFGALLFFGHVVE